jgi:hypothetical protein
MVGLFLFLDPGINLFRPMALGSLVLYETLTLINQRYTHIQFDSVLSDKTFDFNFCLFKLLKILDLSFGDV